MADQSKFPRIEIVQNSSFRYHEENTAAYIRIFFYPSKNQERIDITSTTTLMIMDPYNLSFGDLDPVVVDLEHSWAITTQGYIIKTDGVGITFLREGTGILKAAYQFNGEFLTDQIEFVIYKNFFRENYRSHLIPKLEKQKLDNNPKFGIFMDTIMEYFDITWAYRKDLEGLQDPIYSKSKFINNLGQNLGFERLDFENESTDLAFISERTYRELLANILDLVAIRGSVLSYELFFNALGFDISINEFWWDDDSNLIEINPLDENLNTYYAYAEDGSPLDTPQLPRQDPRQFASPDNDWNVNSKSPYIRVLLEQKPGINIDNNPSQFTKAKRELIKKYLEFLRPQHIKYLTEILKAAFDEEEIEFLLNIVEEIDQSSFQALQTSGSNGGESNGIVYPPDPGLINDYASGFGTYYNFDTQQNEEIYNLTNGPFIGGGGFSIEEIWNLFGLNSFTTPPNTQNSLYFVDVNEELNFGGGTFGGLKDNDDTVFYLLKWDREDVAYDTNDNSDRWDYGELVDDGFIRAVKFTVDSSTNFLLNVSNPSQSEVNEAFQDPEFTEHIEKFYQGVQF